MSFLEMINFLIDTHVFLWLIFSPDNLSKKILQQLADPKNKVFVSAISLWEIALKYSLGKLSLVDVLPNELPDLALKMDIQIIHVAVEEYASFYQLPLIEGHKDPFDRMIIWQCISKKMVLVSHDDKFSDYLSLGLAILK